MVEITDSHKIQPQCPQWQCNRSGAATSGIMFTLVVQYPILFHGEFGNIT